jgi:nucleotide-binding universal stress UspA family protein
MPFKSILSVVELDHPDDDLSRVIDLGAETNAHLSVLVIGLAAPPPIMEYATLADEREEDTARLNHRVEEITATVSRAGISFDVNRAYVDMTWVHSVVGRHARYADLTVICGSLMEEGQLGEATLKGALFESARPVLIVPKGAVGTLRPKVILLAWDSSLEAARVAYEAIELMAAAESVHVTLIDPDTSSEANGPEPGADVAAWLTRHGIKVTVDQLPSGGRATAEVLRHHAMDVAADLLVMGGYSHSRVREHIFGGVTSAMIEEATIPLFMAH